MRLDPLLQFLLGGAVLFALHAWLGEDLPDDNAIVISAGEVAAIRTAWEAQWRRPPSDGELAALVDARVREEVLYREALALGLDEGDTIIRRRLAQKVEFLFDDGAEVADPDAAALQAWYAAQAARFIDPPRHALRQAWFSPDRRPDPDADAAAALAGLADPTAADPPPAGDPFLLGNRFGERDAQAFARDFGERFAAALPDLPTGRWTGPVRSGYGAHLVYVEHRVPARLPPLDAIRAEVLQAWREQAQRDAREAAVQAALARYVVRIEPGQVPE